MALCYRFDLGGETNATYNYWGTSDYPEVLDKLCSFYQNVSLSVVDVLPFLATEDYHNTASMPQGMLRSGANIAGGDVRNDVSLPKNKNYSVTRSIIIRYI